MTTVYRIAKWQERFENAQSRKYRALSWFPCPNKHDGNGLRRIATRENRCDLYAGFLLMAAVASKCEDRGVLADERGPLDAEDLAVKTGFPREVFEACFLELSEPKIAWLERGDWERGTIRWENDGDGWEPTGSAGPPGSGPAPSGAPGAGSGLGADSEHAGSALPTKEQNRKNRKKKLLLQPAREQVDAVLEVLAGHELLCRVTVKTLGAIIGGVNPSMNCVAAAWEAFHVAAIDGIHSKPASFLRGVFNRYDKEHREESLRRGELQDEAKRSRERRK